VRERIHQLVDKLPVAKVEHLLQTLEKENGETISSGQKTFGERAAEIAASIPEEERKKVPADFLSNLDHYIYGTPKK
jgi:hypothetical protein